ncbi:hypothetical protein Val02_39090 [Virgisporangium aliadipatigenens]|uniref:AB hydrolase-1 domain-containing protein n=1 Tax=Virgisporangium aliadipatigenens TaxID=741659 RepID=A0A8J4DRQ6_9ACTN|nr:alpha/beta fold hydrolase [Virgisporangium aliadipatigenens]GIJ47023.1 hypothetical protein Val02_39090 [Virgisporangium aliadipatigenens]
MTTDSSTFVLVPGAWHGGWAWHPVAARLRAAGHHAVTFTPPGLDHGDDVSSVTLADAVDRLTAVIARHTDVVVVSHSWGGIPATAAAYRVPERVSRLVYFSSVVPRPGVSMNDELPAEGAAYVRATIEASPDRAVHVLFEQVQQLLMQDEPEPVQRLAHDLLMPHPGRYFLDPYDGPDPGTGGIPASYLLAADDRALARPGSEFAARVGVEPVVVPGSHEALLTHPDELSKALLAL